VDDRHFSPSFLKEILNFKRIAALLQLLYNFQLILTGYICLILRQNGGAGVFEGEEGVIPQYLNILLWMNVHYSCI